MNVLQTKPHYHAGQIFKFSPFHRFSEKPKHFKIK